jgi:hypothetical protein
MKHGDKAKSAKTKASGNQKAGAKGGKAVETGKKAPAAAQKNSGAKAEAKAPAKGGGKAPAKAAPGNGAAKPRAAITAGTPGFSNPVVANAFKRAVKKFPNAFRKLTD